MVDNVGFSFGYSAKDALPAWRAFSGTNELFTAGLDTVFQDGLEGFQSGYGLTSGTFQGAWNHPLLVEGKYGFYIFQNYVVPINHSITQRGLIPSDAKFLQFRCMNKKAGLFGGAVSSLTALFRWLHLSSGKR